MYAFSKEEWFNIYSDIEVLFSNDDTMTRMLDYDRHYLCMVQGSNILKINKSMRVGMHLAEHDKLDLSTIEAAVNYKGDQIKFTCYEALISDENLKYTIYYGYVTDRGFDLGEFNILDFVIKLNLQYHDKFLHIKDNQMRMLNVNTVWYELKHHNRHAAKGLTYSDWFGSDSIVPMEKEMQVIMSGEKLEFDWETKDFSRHYKYKGTILPIPGEDKTAGIATILDFELIEDKHVHHIKDGRKIQDMLNFFGMYYWEHSTDRYELSISKKLLLDLGYEKHEITEHGILDEYIHPDDLDIFIEGWFKQRRTDEVFTQFRMREKNGNYRWFLRHVKIKRVPGTRTYLYMACLFIDIDAFKTQEKKLMESKLKAEQLAEQKTNFLANMSHEIRTPMNSIIGFGDLLLGTELTAKQRDYAEKSNQAAKNLLGILNDILDISKVEAGKLTIENTQVIFDDIINNIENIMKVKVSESSIDFRVVRDEKVPKYIKSDGLRINQILLNLCNNAIKFTHEGYVELRVEYLDKDQPQIKLLVQDTGIGMTKEQLNNMFKPFTQADSSTTRKYGGTGLGLSITKELVSLLGGSIKVSSKEWQGTTFEVLLPCIESDGSELEDDSLTLEENPLEDYAHNPILLVEDNPVNCEIIDENLKIYGINVDFAVNGLEAINKIRSMPNHYKLILMDLHMPVMDGIDATEWIRTLYDESQLPIIALTADVFKETLSQIKQVGMQDFLTKPIDANLLISTLKKYLEARETTKEHAEVQVIDKEAALRLLSHNEKIYTKIKKSFVEYLKKEPVLAQDSDSIKDYLHNIKGLLGTVGAVQLGKVVEADYEKLKYGGSLGSLDDYLSKLDLEMKNVISAIESEKEVILVANNPMKAIMDKLRTYVVNYDGQSKDQVKLVKKNIIDAYGENFYDDLLYNLDIFDFAKALELLDSIKE